MQPQKTKITELLDAHGIPYNVLPHTEPVFTVDAAARQRGVIKEEIVKAILLVDRRGQYVMACVTGDARLDPKAVRAQLPEGWKRLHFASAEQVFEITGCVQGAVTPLNLPDSVPVVFDEGIAHREKVNISSGDPMAGLELDAQDLIRIAGARLALIAERA